MTAEAITRMIGYFAIGLFYFGIFLAVLGFVLEMTYIYRDWRKEKTKPKGDSSTTDTGDPWHQIR